MIPTEDQFVAAVGIKLIPALAKAALASCASEARRELFAAWTIVTSNPAVLALAEG